MLTEQSAYTNRWRHISPTAKGFFCLSGIIAAFSSRSPQAALLVALILATTTVFGARVPAVRYLRIAAPALLFLLASGVSLLVSLDFGSSLDGISFGLAKNDLPRVAQVFCRSLACLAALLFLTLTTPLSDLIALLRRCRFPDTLLDMMTLCYRTLFVLSEVVHETFTAQSARLGYATATISLRSLGTLISNLLVQVWQRSLALHTAAEARGNDGALRFLENDFPHTRHSMVIALASGGLMIAAATLLP